MTEYFQLKFFTKSLTGEGHFERMAIMKCQFGEAASVENQF